MHTTPSEMLLTPASSFLTYSAPHLYCLMRKTHCLHTNASPIMTSRREGRLINFLTLSSRHISPLTLASSDSFNIRIGENHPMLPQTIKLLNVYPPYLKEASHSLRCSIIAPHAAFRSQIARHRVFVHGKLEEHSKTRIDCGEPRYMSPFQPNKNSGRHRSFPTQHKAIEPCFHKPLLVMINFSPPT